MELVPHLRPAAYAVCIEHERILLARWMSPRGPLWTLPGGGLEHGEDPYDAVLREVTEETGYRVGVDALLGVDSLHTTYPTPPPARDFHGLRFVYAAHVTGGELRHEVNGSTDMAAWVPLAEIAGTEHTRLIELGLRLHRERPPTGHLTT